MGKDSERKKDLKSNMPITSMTAQSTNNLNRSRRDTNRQQRYGNRSSLKVCWEKRTEEKFPWLYKRNAFSGWSSEEEKGTGIRKVWVEGNGSLTNSPLNKIQIMEHLTNFELILVGVCITLFCFGFNAFIKNVYLRNFNTHKSWLRTTDRKGQSVKSG